MQLLAQNPLRDRPQLLTLEHFFPQQGCPARLLDDWTGVFGDLAPHGREAAGIVVTTEPLTGSDLPALLAAVESEPAWSDLTFLVLAKKQSAPRSAK